jgi:hypothetical protein
MCCKLSIEISLENLKVDMNMDMNMNTYTDNQMGMEIDKVTDIVYVQLHVHIPFHVRVCVLCPNPCLLKKGHGH